MSLDAIGGEPLAGSGFETEEPELEFSSAELSGEEQRPWQPLLPSPPKVGTQTNQHSGTSARR